MKENIRNYWHSKIIQYHCFVLVIILSLFFLDIRLTAFLTVIFASSSVIPTKARIHPSSHSPLKGVISANKRQRELMVGKIKRLVGDLRDKVIGILGLAFKQNTDDIRESAQIPHTT